MKNVLANAGGCAMSIYIATAFFPRRTRRQPVCDNGGAQPDRPKAPELATPMDKDKPDILGYTPSQLPHGSS